MLPAFAIRARQIVGRTFRNLVRYIGEDDSQKIELAGAKCAADLIAAYLATTFEVLERMGEKKIEIERRAETGDIILYVEKLTGTDRENLFITIHAPQRKDFETSHLRFDLNSTTKNPAPALGYQMFFNALLTIHRVANHDPKKAVRGLLTWVEGAESTEEAISDAVKKDGKAELVCFMKPFLKLINLDTKIFIGQVNSARTKEATRIGVNYNLVPKIALAEPSF